MKAVKARDRMALLEIGRRVRHFRTQLELTQEAVARAAKVTPKFLSQIENGRVNPSIGVLVRLVTDGLRTTMAVFFSWEPTDADTHAMVALLAVQPKDLRTRVVRAMQVLLERREK